MTDALNLPALRVLKGLTQHDVAKEMGMSRLTYLQHEKNPDSFSLGQWKRLAAILEFDPANVNIIKLVPCDKCKGTGLVEETKDNE